MNGTHGLETVMGTFGIAQYSGLRKYRYTLDVQVPARRDSGMIQFIGLNPSTADHDKPDPTVKKCLEWSEKWGFGRFVMTNAFGYRATDPKDMKSQREPNGPFNDYMLEKIAQEAEAIVVCWGNHADHKNRVVQLREILKPYAAKVRCLKRNKTGHPCHPLYLPKSSTLQAFSI